MRFYIFSGFLCGILIGIAASDGRYIVSVYTVTEPVFISLFIRNGAACDTVRRVERVFFGNGKVPNGDFNGYLYGFVALRLNGHFRLVKSGSLVFVAVKGYPIALICVFFDVQFVQVGTVTAYRNKQVGIPAFAASRDVILRNVVIILIIQRYVFYLLRAAVKHKVGYGNANIFLRVVGSVNELHTLALVFGKSCRKFCFGSGRYFLIFPILFGVGQQIDVLYSALNGTARNRAARKKRNNEQNE